MLLTAAEIAKILRIDRRRVYELLQLKPEHGGIPHYEFGRTKRVDFEMFEKWMQERLKS